MKEKEHLMVAKEKNGFVGLEERQHFAVSKEEIGGLKRSIFWGNNCTTVIMWGRGNWF